MPTDTALAAGAAAPRGASRFREALTRFWKQLLISREISAMHEGRMHLSHPELYQKRMDELRAQMSRL